MAGATTSMAAPEDLLTPRPLVAARCEPLNVVTPSVTALAVNCLDSSAMGTCQNPEVKSKVEKYAAPTRLSTLFHISQVRGGSLFLLKN